MAIREMVSRRSICRETTKKDQSGAQNDNYRLRDKRSLPQLSITQHHLPLFSFDLLSYFRTGACCASFLQTEAMGTAYSFSRLPTFTFPYLSFTVFSLKFFPSFPSLRIHISIISLQLFHCPRLKMKIRSTKRRRYIHLSATRRYLFSTN